MAAQKKKLHILFMCVANSARSQLAHGLANQIFGSNIVIESAGSEPSQVNPLAIQVMKEMGIDISSHYSKSVDGLSHKFIAQLDYVITLCAEEVCPMLISHAKKLHWPHPDPGKTGTQEQRLQSFREIRNSIRERLLAFKAEIEA